MATELENNQEALLTLAKQNFKRWNDALLTKNPEEVARLYTPNNSFLPSLSLDFHHGHQGAENYFEHFLAKNPEGIGLLSPFISLAKKHIFTRFFMI